MNVQVVPNPRREEIDRLRHALEFACDYIRWAGERRMTIGGLVSRWGMDAVEHPIRYLDDLLQETGTSPHDDEPAAMRDASRNDSGNGDAAGGSDLLREIGIPSGGRCIASR